MRNLPVQPKKLVLLNNIMKKDPSAEVFAHIKHNKWEMVKDLAWIAVTMIALCAVIAWIQYHPEQIK